MTEYLDELIRLFRKARPRNEISYQDEEVKNRLLAGLPTEALIEINGYLDLTAAEIAQSMMSNTAKGILWEGPHWSLLKKHCLLYKRNKLEVMIYNL